MSGLSIGSISARPGKITTGWFDAVSLPSGGMDRFPLIVAQGRADGPVMWIATGIHGAEHTGPIALQELISPQLVKNLRGTIVAILSLNPAGLRTKQRASYYSETDPNRLFPKPGVGPAVLDKNGKPRSALELAYLRLFDAIVATQPAALIDLHNASIGSIPFSLRDPVFYHHQRGKSPTHKQASILVERVGSLANAIGFTPINEYAAGSYIKQNLDRSLTGSILNGGLIPSLTLELGSWMFVDPGVVEACKSGLRNALRWAGMLDDTPEPIIGIPLIAPGYPVRRADGIPAPVTGIVHHLARSGEMVVKDQPLARMTDIFGRPLGEDDGLIRSQHDGFVYGWSHGVVRYQGETIMNLAVRDAGEMVAPYPE